MVDDPLPGTFVALDFETADATASSACAVAAVCFQDGVETQAVSFVLKTRATDFRFSHLHGIDLESSRSGVDFIDAWRDMSPLIEKSGSVIVAHNASFDRRVLQACMRMNGQRTPRLRYLCSRNIVEATWPHRPVDLASVCIRLGIPLRHHEALSDARAAGLIWLAARKEQLRLRSAVEAG